MSFGEVIRGHGMCPRTTPVDVLMAGTVPMHLAVAEAMTEADDSEPELGELGFHDIDEDLVLQSCEPEDVPEFDPRYYRA